MVRPASVLFEILILSHWLQEKNILREALKDLPCGIDIGVGHRFFGPCIKLLSCQLDLVELIEALTLFAVVALLREWEVEGLAVMPVEIKAESAG